MPQASFKSSWFKLAQLCERRRSFESLLRTDDDGPQVMANFWNHLMPLQHVQSTFHFVFVIVYVCLLCTVVYGL